MEDRDVNSQVSNDDKELCKVSVKIPPFWVDKPEIWFFQVEAQFKISGITAEETKFNYLVSQLDPKYVENVWDIVSSISQTKYSDSKSRLLNLFKESESKNSKINHRNRTWRHETQPTAAKIKVYSHF